MLTFALIGFLGDLAQDERIGDNDDNERHDIYGENVEEVVGELVLGCWKEVKCDTLCEFRIGWMVFYMEYNTLKTNKQTNLTPIYT